jgi:integrase
MDAKRLFLGWDRVPPQPEHTDVTGRLVWHALVVDIDAATAKILRGWRRDRAARSLQLARGDVYMFATLDGSPRNPNALSQMFTRRVAKARKALGVDALPDTTLHSLRHTHATVLLEARENPKIVQERLGHTTITTTMDVYSHVTPTRRSSWMQVGPSPRPQGGAR